MSRSKHTTPPPLRAACRLRAPYAPRSDGDHSRRHAHARLLKEHGVVSGQTGSASDEYGIAAGKRGAAGEQSGPVPWPRLHIQRPRAGHIHAASGADLRRLLSFFGEQCCYGLRSIELARGDDAPGATLRLGRLLVPGRIVLYDHEPSPWLLPGLLPARQRERLRRGGALVETTGLGRHTIVTWPGSTLRDFMLFDVFMHEVGHHMIQQYTGKYRARVMRTRDHEAAADRFAARCRRLYHCDAGAP